MIKKLSKLIFIAIISIYLFGCTSIKVDSKDISSFKNLMDKSNMITINTHMNSETSSIKFYNDKKTIGELVIDAKGISKVTQLDGKNFMFYYNNEVVNIDISNKSIEIKEFNYPIENISVDKVNNSYLYNKNIGLINGEYISEFSIDGENFYKTQNSLLHSLQVRGDFIYSFVRKIDKNDPIVNTKSVEKYDLYGNFIETIDVDLSIYNNDFNFDNGIIKDNNIIFMNNNIMFVLDEDDNINIKDISNNDFNLIGEINLFNINESIYGISSNGVIFKVTENLEVELLKQIEVEKGRINTCTYNIINDQIVLNMSIFNINDNNEREFTFKSYYILTDIVEDLNMIFNFDRSTDMLIPESIILK